MGIHIQAINSNLTVWLSAHMARECACDETVVCQLGQREETSGFAASFSYLCLRLCCGIVCLQLFRDIEGRTQEEHNYLGQCSLQQLVLENHDYRSVLQLKPGYRTRVLPFERVISPLHRET